MRTPEVRKRIQITRGALALLSAIALASCSNAVESVRQTASSAIKPCSKNLYDPNSPIQVELSPSTYQSDEKAFKAEVTILKERAEKNGGEIVVNRLLGIGVKVKDGDLEIKYDDNAATVVGFQSDIKFRGETPELGLGALACDQPNGQVVATNLDHVIATLVNETSNFPTN